MRLRFLVESLILYLAFFKTILAALFRAFGLLLSFLPSKPSFLLDHSTTQHSDFSSFLAVSATDKPVNRSIIQAYALKQLNVFALRGFIFRDIHKKQRRSLSNSGYEIQKTCGWKIYSRTRTFCAEVHKFESKGGTISMKIVNYIERHNFCCNDLLTNSNHTEIQTFEVEERTFGTPCSCSKTKAEM